MSTGIDGTKAFNSFINTAERFTKANSRQGETLSCSERDALKTMLDSMNGVQRQQAMTNLRTYNPGAADQLR